MDIKEIEALVDKLSEAREAGYGMIIDSFLEVQKDLDPNPVMLMKELEHLVQRATKVYSGELPSYWYQDMITRIGYLQDKVNDIHYGAV